MKFGTFFNQIDTAVDNNEIKSLNDGFELLVPMGLSFVDVYATLLEEKYTANSLWNILKEHGLTTASVFNITNFDYNRDGILNDLRENAKIHLENCAKLECKMYMPVPTVEIIHPSDADRERCREMIAEHINDVVDIASDYDISVVIENFSDTKTPFATISDVEYILGQLPEVKYVLDTGNFWFNNSDILSATSKFADRIVHVHLKDIEPNSNGQLNICGNICDSVAIGKGIIPFNEIFDLLCKSGYNKIATIELNDNRDIMEKITSSLSYLKNLSDKER